MNAIRKIRVAGVVVLYNPDFSVHENIASYLNELDSLIVIDNSESTFPHLNELTQNPKVVYRQYESNIGMAEALNVAANLAVKNSFDFLLTMDQDSSFKAGDLIKLLSFLDRMDISEIGILSPVHIHDKMNMDMHNEEISSVDFVMTSGNLLNLKSFTLVGPFLSSLFIDHVDHEYCLRLRSRGFKIIEVKEIHLAHSLGETKRIQFFGFDILKFISHQPLRTYYIIRNGLYVSRTYKKEFPEFKRVNNKLLRKEIIKLWFEDRKWVRFKMIVLAVKHFRSSRLGKLQIS